MLLAICHPYSSCTVGSEDPIMEESPANKLKAIMDVVWDLHTGGCRAITFASNLPEVPRAISNARRVVKGTDLDSGVQEVSLSSRRHEGSGSMQDLQSIP